MGRDLTAQLAADAAAAACHQDGLALDLGEDLPHLHGDGRPPQQVLHRHRPQLVQGHLAVGQLVQRRQRLELAPRLAAQRQQPAPLLHGQGGDGDEDLVHAVALRRLRNDLAAAYHRHAVDGAAPLVGIVVDDAAGHGVRRLAGFQLPQHRLSRGARPDDHGVVYRPGVFPPAGGQQPDEPIGEPDGRHHQELSQRADDVVGHRHPAHKGVHAHPVEHAGDSRGSQTADQLVEAGEPPQAVIQPQQEEHRQTHGGVHRREPQERGQILRRDGAVPHVIAQPQRQKVGGIHRQRVVQEQAQ